jgi:hypothetical protein
MKLICQIAAGILLAFLLQWLFVSVLVPAFMLAQLGTSSHPETVVPAPVRPFDADNPCAHMEYGSSVRRWCEENEAAQKQSSSDPKSAGQ